MELHPPLHLSVVAIEKGAFWSPLTKVANFTYLLSYKDGFYITHKCWYAIKQKIKTIV